MKRLIALCLCLCLLVPALSGCAGGEKKVLYVCNWGEYMDESLNAEFYEQTGIKVVYDTFDTNESLYALLQGGNVKYDVIVPSDYMVEKLIAEDMLAPLDGSLLPNRENLFERYRSMPSDPQSEYAVPYLWGVLGIIYNTTMVDSAPTSWDALWDGQYSGDILMIGNQRDAMAISLKRLGFSLNTVSETEILGAANELQKQKPLLQGYFMDLGYNKMEGAGAAMFAYYSGDAMLMVQANSDLAFVVPEEGSNVYMDFMCIPKTSGHADWASQYINFMLDAENAARNAEAACGSTPVEAAWELLDPEMKENPCMYPPQELLDRCEYSEALPDEIYAMYNDIWIELGQ